MALEFELISYTVNKEVDFVENDIEKIRCELTVNFKPVDDVNNICSIQTRAIEVINLNTQTGVEMDTQRWNECETFVNNL